MIRKTLKNPCFFSGVGIHSGVQAQLHIKPASTGEGLCFFRTDLNHRIPVSPAYVLSTARATLLGDTRGYIKTPEHLLAACAGLGLTDLVIEIDAEEVPILDGSSLAFIQGMKAAHLCMSDVSVQPLVITTPVVVSEGEGMVIALPSSEPRYTYTLDYPATFIGSQISSWPLTEAIFEAEIAPARTYGFFKEVEALLKNGLAKGGSLENAVIIGETGYMTPLRFPDELARHKVLDLIGDMVLLGRPILGHLIGIKSGHSLNAKMVHHLQSLTE